MPRFWTRGRRVVIKSDDDILPAMQNTRCAKCNELPTAEGHDPCIANMPGLVAGCCGHGNPNQAYLYFRNGVTVRHFDTIERESPEYAERCYQIFNRKKSS